MKRISRFLHLYKGISLCTFFSFIIVIIYSICANDKMGNMPISYVQRFFSILHDLALAIIGSVIFFYIVDFYKNDLIRQRYEEKIVGYLKQINMLMKEIIYVIIEKNDYIVGSKEAEDPIKDINISDIRRIFEGRKEITYPKNKDYIFQLQKELMEKINVITKLYGNFIIKEDEYLLIEIKETNLFTIINMNTRLDFNFKITEETILEYLKIHKKIKERIEEINKYSNMNKKNKFLNSLKSKGHKCKKWFVVNSSQIICAVISGLIVGILMYISSNFILTRENNRKKIIEYNNEISKINKIMVGISENYIRNNLGEPVIDYVDKNKMDVEYYIKRDKIIKIVYKNRKVVAYFITITNKNDKYLMNKQGWENSSIGQSTFSDIIGNDSFINRIDVGIAGAGHYFFYNELFESGSMFGGDYQVIGFEEYGASFTKNSGDIVDKADSLYQDMESGDRKYDTFEIKDVKMTNNIFQKLKKERKKCYPNTFGEIDEDYVDVITVCDINENWNNIIRILHNCK